MQTQSLLVIQCEPFTIYKHPGHTELTGQEKMLIIFSQCLVCGIYYTESEHFILRVKVRTRNTGVRVTRQLLMARPMIQNVCKTAALVSCSLPVVVSINQNWSEQETLVVRTIDIVISNQGSN